MSAATRAFICASALIPLLVAGCSSNKSRSLPEFESVAVTSILKPADGIQATKDSDTSKAGGGVGAKGGAAAGAATSLLCGPFVVFCLPVLVPAGALVGSTAGGVAGSVADTLQAWPKEQAERAEAILSGIDERRDFFVEIRDGLAAKVPPGRAGTLQDADAVMYVGPKTIELVQSERSRLALRMTAVMNAEWNRDKRTPRTEKREYIYQTDERPVEEWLDEDGAVFDAAFTECIQMIVNSMMWDMKKTTRIPAAS
jgi:hypothetical protein